MLAALPLIRRAPLGEVVDGAPVDTVPADTAGVTVGLPAVVETLAGGAVVVELVELALALAAAWNASKDFSAVGLTAKTIPVWQ